MGNIYTILPTVASFALTTYDIVSIVILYIAHCTCQMSVDCLLVVASLLTSFRPTTYYIGCLSHYPDCHRPLRITTHTPIQIHSKLFVIVRLSVD